MNNDGLLREQFCVIYAIMMHDIKSRFFGNGVGYAVTVIWPLLHICLILVINYGRLVPHGVSMILYAATAAIPFIAVSYVSRFIMLGTVQNKSFLSYPLIKPLDIIFARCVLEVVSSAVVCALTLLGMFMIGIDVMPHDVVQAAYAWGAAIFLGVGLGTFNGVVAMGFVFWQIAYVGFIIVSWLTSGIGIDPEALPEIYGYYLSFNPVLHVVEWMRSAYYLDFHPHLLDKTYLLSFAALSLVLGLIIERFGRPFLLQSR